MIAAAALAAASPATSYAQPDDAPPAIAAAAPGRAAVSVRIGRDLRVQRPSYDRQEYDQLTDALVRATAPAAAKGGFTRLDLVLEYARPNRPTFNQLARQPGLSFGGSIGVGGATVTGTATRADGTTAPITFSWYESDLGREVGADTWRDAQRAFQYLGDDLAHGRAPDHYGPGRLTPRTWSGGVVF